jgi:hypothetical protein
MDDQNVPRVEVDIVPPTKEQAAQEGAAEDFTARAAPLPLCDTTMTPRLPREKCMNCGTYPANLGPCQTYLEGANGRCVYCDHHVACHMATPIHSWKEVKYMLQAPIAIPGLRDPVVRDIVGRAVGLRDDGETFSATMLVPWVVDANYNWQVKAFEHLNTFAMDTCTCIGGDEDVVVCAYHLHIMRGWHGREPQEDPTPPRRPGPVPHLQPMHRDYPWTYYDPRTREWVCTMCNARQGAMDNNSTWRNQFIRKHSACGFVDPATVLPWSIEDKVLMELGRRLEAEYHRTFDQRLDTVRGWLLNQRGTLVIEDERKPKELPPHEAAKVLGP